MTVAIPKALTTIAEAEQKLHLSRTEITASSPNGKATSQPSPSESKRPWMICDAAISISAQKGNCEKEP